METFSLMGLYIICSDGQLGYVWDIFEPTILMPTYLVAFLVSEYEFVESSPAVSNVTFRVWARPEWKSRTA